MGKQDDLAHSVCSMQNDMQALQNSGENYVTLRRGPVVTSHHSPVRGSCTQMFVLIHTLEAWRRTDLKAGLTRGLPMGTNDKSPRFSLPPFSPTPRLGHSQNTTWSLDRCLNNRKKSYQITASLLPSLDGGRTLQIRCLSRPFGRQYHTATIPRQIVIPAAAPKAPRALFYFTQFIPEGCSSAVNNPSALETLSTLSLGASLTVPQYHHAAYHTPSPYTEKTRYHD